MYLLKYFYIKLVYTNRKTERRSPTMEERSEIQAKLYREMKIVPPAMSTPSTPRTGKDIKLSYRPNLSHTRQNSTPIDMRLSFTGKAPIKSHGPEISPTSLQQELPPFPNSRKKTRILTPLEIQIAEKQRMAERIKEELKTAPKKEEEQNEINIKEINSSGIKQIAKKTEHENKLFDLDDLVEAFSNNKSKQNSQMEMGSVEKEQVFNEREVLKTNEKEPRRKFKFEDMDLYATQENGTITGKKIKIDGSIAFSYPEKSCLKLEVNFRSSILENTKGNPLSGMEQDRLENYLSEGGTKMSICYEDIENFRYEVESNKLNNNDNEKYYLKLVFAAPNPIRLININFKIGEIVDVTEIMFLISEFANMAGEKLKYFLKVRDELELMHGELLKVKKDINSTPTFIHFSDGEINMDKENAPTSSVMIAPVTLTSKENIKENDKHNELKVKEKFANTYYQFFPIYFFKVYDNLLDPKKICEEYKLYLEKLNSPKTALQSSHRPKIPHQEIKPLNLKKTLLDEQTGFTTTSSRALTNSTRETQNPIPSIRISPSLPLESPTKSVSLSNEFSKQPQDDIKLKKEPPELPPFTHRSRSKSVGSKTQSAEAIVETNRLQQK
jgi:hypothetical protein